MRKAVIAIVAFGLPPLLLVGCPPSFSDLCMGVAECSFGDATVQSDAADAGMDAEPECDPDGAFTLDENVEVIPNFPSWRARHVSFSSDEKTVYFHASPDGGQYDLFVGTRQSRSLPFEPKDIHPIPEISAADIDDVDPAVSDNELTIIFSRETQQSASLFMAMRSNRTGTFEKEEELTSLNSAKDEGNPYLAFDGGELWFASDRPDGGDGNSRLYRALAGGDHFRGANAMPVKLPAPITKVTSPVLSADGKILFFSTFGLAYEVRRDSIDQVFTAPARVLNELGNTKFVYPSWVSPDGCRLYIHRSGPPIKIQVAVRAPKKTDP